MSKERAIGFEPTTSSSGSYRRNRPGAAQVATGMVHNICSWICKCSLLRGSFGERREAG